jgi:hypothetical protein
VETGVERALSHVDENRGFMTYFQSDKPSALGLAMSLFLVFFDDMASAILTYSRDVRVL